jgi:hypothetical protein
VAKTLTSKTTAMFLLNERINIPINANKATACRLLVIKYPNTVVMAKKKTKYKNILFVNTLDALLAILILYIIKLKKLIINNLFF